MRRTDLLTPTVNILLATLVGICGAGCLTTGFHLPVRVGSVVLCCLLWAAAVIIGLRFRRGWMALLGFGALWLGFLWLAGTGNQLLTVLQICFDLYQIGYGWTLPALLTPAFRNGDVTLAIQLIAGICTAVTALALTRRRSVAIPIVAMLLPLVPCLIVTDTPPSDGYLFLLLLCLGLLVMTQSVRRLNPRQGSVLTAVLLIPVTLFTLFLFHNNPREDYQIPDTDSIASFFGDLLEKLLPDTGHIDIDIDINNTSGPKVDLQQVGPHGQSMTEVMVVQTNIAGSLYLRGMSYDLYTGTGWAIDETTSPEIFSTPAEYGFYTLYLSYRYTLSISTKSPHSFRYFPYYPYSSTPDLLHGMLPNPNGDTTYSYTVNPLSEQWQRLWNGKHPDVTLGNYNQYSSVHCTDLPENTAAEARKILEMLHIDADTAPIEAAKQIADYVRSSATYSLNTGYMPDTATDFALWFLEDSDTGYCVHFATATAVLLRAAGISARYVEGYLIDSQPGSAQSVREYQAHAWVEYYLPDLGWVMLESTPAQGLQPDIPDPTRPTEGTLPSQTTPPTQTTPPSQGETTLPPETTMPATDPTVPTTPEPPTEAPHQNPPWLLIALLCTIGLLALTLGQWRMRLSCRRKRLHRGTPNTQALARWQYTELLARLRRQPAPEALKALAQKAKYSQYTLTEEELSQFDGYFQRSIAHLRQRPVPMRLVYRLIFAAY